MPTVSIVTKAGTGTARAATRRRTYRGHLGCQRLSDPATTVGSIIAPAAPNKGSVSTAPRTRPGVDHRRGPRRATEATAWPSPADVKAPTMMIVPVQLNSGSVVRRRIHPLATIPSSSPSSGATPSTHQRDVCLAAGGSDRGPAATGIGSAAADGNGIGCRVAISVQTNESVARVTATPMSPETAPFSSVWV